MAGSGPGGAGPITHARVLRLALPLTLAHLSTPLLGLTDTVVIGRLGDETLLAGLAVSANLFNVIFWVFGFLRMGTSGMTAQAVGAGDLGEQKAVFLRALLIAFGCGVLLIALRWPLAAVSFAAMDASPAATAAARAYFDIRILSAPMALANYAVLGWLVGCGRTDVGFALQVLINVANIGLAIAAVNGLGLGVAGSAWATVLAETCGTVAGLMAVGRLLRGTSAVPRAVLFDPARLWRTFAVNRDLMLRTIAVVAAFSFFTAQGARAGDDTVAANALLMNLYLLSSHFLDGFAVAAEQMCGTAFGAGDASRFRRAVVLTTVWSLGFGLGCSLLCALAGPGLIDFMTTTESVRREALAYLGLAALTPFAGALAFQFDGVYAGATWTGAMRNLMLAALAVFLALWWASRPFGNGGLWLALLGFLLTRGLGQALAYPGLERRAFGIQPGASVVAS